MMNQALVVFVKNPELGKAKTRIAKDAGDQEALNIYKELLEITKNTITALEIDIHIFYAQNIAENDLWSESNFDRHIQHGHDLGERMLHAFEKLFDEGYQQVVLMGSDCPYINEAHILAAFSELTYHDVCAGPTFDGGYYLIGMKEAHATLFENMEWSVDTVLSESIERAKKQNLSFLLLEKLEDIDHWEDWKKYKMSLNPS